MGVSGVGELRTPSFQIASRESYSNALRRLEVRKTLAGAPDLKLFDGHGLYLLIRLGGSRLWRFKYHKAGHEKLLALGIYPDTSLELARERLDEARRLLTSGVDPSVIPRATCEAPSPRS